VARDRVDAFEPVWLELHGHNSSFAAQHASSRAEEPL
jgi:hypothetical protein